MICGHVSHAAHVHGGLPGYVVVNGCTTVQEDDDADEGGRDQHLCVQAQPGKVESDLLTKVLPEGDKTIKCPGSEFQPTWTEGAEDGGGGGVWTSVLTAQVQRAGT